MSEDFVKYDQDKPQYSLIPTRPLAELAKVYSLGAHKYSPENWRKGTQWSRIYSALQRHLNAFWGGEDKDPETGLLHLQQAAWGCFTLCEFLLSDIGTDDRADR